MYSKKRRFRLFRAPGPPAGPPGPPIGISTDILSFSRTLASTFRGYDISPVNGGTLTLNSKAAGNYEVTARKSNTTLSSFTASDWFTNTKDTTSSWVVVNGDLTINGAVTFTPPVRKLFMVLYVTGNLTFTGEISMTARGANHSGTGDSGGYTAPVDIRIATGTFTGVLDYTPGSTTNPSIPAVGASGGAATIAEGAPNSGSNGTNGQTGGGTSGVLYIPVGTNAGAGAAGTCFSGGAGGGSQDAGTTAATSGGANGGAGGSAGGNTASNTIGGGGAGNPGGTGNSNNSSSIGQSGTGGTLVIICEGIVDGGGGGAIYSRGSSGGVYLGVDGGGSGGGSITLLYGNISALTTVWANGTGTSPGGSGSWRRYAIGTN